MNQNVRTILICSFFSFCFSAGSYFFMQLKINKIEKEMDSQAYSNFVRGYQINRPCYAGEISDDLIKEVEAGKVVGENSLEIAAVDAVKNRCKK